MEFKEKIIKEIKEGKNEYFNYGHFDKSNMVDYFLMQYAVKDLMAVYQLTEIDAVDIIVALTH